MVNNRRKVAKGTSSTLTIEYQSDVKINENELISGIDKSNIVDLNVSEKDISVVSGNIDTVSKLLQNISEMGIRSDKNNY